MSFIERNYMTLIGVVIAAPAPIVYFWPSLFWSAAVLLATVGVIAAVDWYVQRIDRRPP